VKRLLVVVSFFFVALATFAQDVRTPNSQLPARLLPTSGGHVGLFAPPRDPDDTLFVTDVGPDLDTDCVYSDHGPLVIHVSVKRYVGSDIAGQVAKGLLSEKAKLILPAWDVDIDGRGIPNERDVVTFNGRFVGTLDGSGFQWKLNTFEIPVSWINFPSLVGGQAVPADNVVQIDIDTNGTGVWCTAVDWVELEFKATAPVLLVHGTNAQSDTWNPHFTNFFQGTGMPWTNDINLDADGSIAGNGAKLARRVSDIARGFGAKKVNIIAHSKGGLDTRAYLNNQYDPEDVKVVSVYTLSTPHHGTIVSDVVVAARAAQNTISNDADIRGVIAADFQSVTPQEPAISQQRTEAMANFNRDFPGIPDGIRFYNYGADADLNNNLRIEGSETAEFLPSAVPDFLASPTATAVYRMIGNAASIRTTTARGIWGSGLWTDIEVARFNDPFALNDLVTSETSAHSPFGTYLGSEDANHSSMKSTSLANRILQHILSDFPNRF